MGGHFDPPGSASVGLSTPTAAATPDPLLTAAQVAGWLGVREKRVYELGIPAVRLSERTLRWRQSQVEAWIKSREGAT